MEGSRDLGSLIGRVLLALIFVMSGLSKVTGFAGTAGYMASAGIPHNLVIPGLLLTIAVELGCGLLVVVGFKARLAALAIFLWLIPVTIIFHFIPHRDAAAQGKSMEALINMIMMMKNLSMMGGLLLVASMGPGRYSVDGNR
ncbi:MAG: DoxX family protein [Candidatus Binataceae bacterium]